MKYSDLNYTDRNDLHTARELIKRKPDIIPLLLRNQSSDLAITILQAARDETERTRHVIKAFVHLADTLSQLEEQPNDITSLG